MPRINWSDDKPDRHGLVEFKDPKTGNTIRTFPTATVYFPSGRKVHGVAVTKEQRRNR
jgi:hypothetical protein